MRRKYRLHFVMDHSTSSWINLLFSIHHKMSGLNRSIKSFDRRTNISAPSYYNSKLHRKTNNWNIKMDECTTTIRARIVTGVEKEINLHLNHEIFRMLVNRKCKKYFTSYLCIKIISPVQSCFLTNLYNLTLLHSWNSI